MTKQLLIWWVVSVLSASTTPAYMNNEQLDLMHYAFEKSSQAEINPELFAKLIDCESKWNPNAKGDYRIEENKFMARGILQFWENTFKTHSKKYNLSRDYTNPYDQIDLAVFMLKEKEGWKHWYNCSKAIKLNK